MAKIILVTANWAPFDKKLRRLCEEVAREKGLEFEVREEDWVFLGKYGEKSETGGADIPQAFLEKDDGTIIHLLTRVPINERGKADFDMARKVVEEKISSNL